MTQPIKFGSAEIRPAERQLLVDGLPVAIGARAFDVLKLLITHRDRVVGKEELLEAAWPGLVVEDNNLQVQISTLRKLLGAGTITTIPGLGYQFTATVDSASSEPAAETGLPEHPNSRSVSRLQRHRIALICAVGMAMVLGLGLWIYKMQPHAIAGAAGTPQPPPHSLAVLPFANISGDPAQDYFSDGLSEELLNSLSSVPDLHVAARTSSFTFKDKGIKIAQIGRELNVGTVLEGSVRKDGQHVRIDAQLVDVGTGYNLWSHSYDRDITNILALQTEIAAAVTEALRATLLPNAAAVIELGGTRDPQAFDDYLKGETLEGRIDKDAVLSRIAAYESATRLDPNFAKAYVGKAEALDVFGGRFAPSADVHEYYAKARESAEKALALAPELGRAHSVLAQILLYGYLDFTQSLAESDRALELSPGDAFVLRRSVQPYALVGRPELALVNAQRAVALDPINGLPYMALGFAHYHARQYAQAIEAFSRALSINPGLGDAAAFRGLSYRRLGRLDSALESCKQPPIDTYNRVCLAIIYHQQGRLPEAEAALAKLKSTQGDAAAMQYVEIYAQWNDVSDALSWLDTAYRARDVGLVSLKENVLLDPLRGESRFQMVERVLQFPN